jgi:hypothetical protein
MSTSTRSGRGTRSSAWCLVGLLGCGGEPIAPVDVSASAPSTMPPPPAVEVPPPTPSASPVTAPLRPTPPTNDELLVLDTIACQVTSAQRLVDCERRWQALLRTPSMPTWIECSLQDDDIRAHAPEANELWRGSFAAERVSEHPLARRCTVASVDTRLAASEHQIQALTDDLVAGVPASANVDELGLRHELETGPVRAVIGKNSSQVRFLAVYLEDLGPLLAIPGRELLSRDELHAALDAQFAAQWPGSWVQGSRKFAPQVEDPKQRLGWGYTPVFTTGVPDDASADGCAFAVPVQATTGRRYLIMTDTLMRDPDYRALTRRLLIQRIVEDALVPTPEAMAYAERRAAEKADD